MPVPVMISNGSETVYQCIHGGTWSVTVSTQKVKEGSSWVVYATLTPTVLSPCTATPPSVGVPPCTLGPLTGAGTSKKIQSNPSVLSSDIQISTTNGIPSVPINYSTKVIA